MLDRPPYHLEQLDHKTRWEATRRHPIYFQLFSIFREAGGGDGTDAWAHIRREPTFLDACNCVQILGPPIDPRLEYADIDGQVSAEFSRLAFTRPAVKTLVGILPRMVQSDTLRQIGIALQKRADAADGLIDVADSLAAMESIINSDQEDLNSMLDAPFYSVSPAAPREMWEAEMAAVQAEWRDRLGLQVRRNHPAKYASYFQAWDLREGWNDGEYSRNGVLPLREVATTLDISLSKAGLHYSRAFELISGHEFTPGNWARVMGIQQLSELFGTLPMDVAIRRAVRAPQQERNNWPAVAESESSDFCEAEPSSEVHSPEESLMNEVLRLIEAGSDNQQIASELGLNFSDDLADGFDFLRCRSDLRSDSES